MSMNLGINVVEVDGATPSIQGAPTSVAAFVIRSQRGVPGVVRQVSSFTQFTDYFGGYVNGKDATGTQTTYLGAYAVRGFFDNGGTMAYVSRVVDTSANSTSRSASAAFAMIQADGTPVGVLVTAAFRGQHDPGVWGNGLAVSLTANLNAPSAFDLTVSGVATLKTLESWTKLVVGGAAGAQDPTVINDPSAGSKLVSWFAAAPWKAGAYPAGCVVTNGPFVYVTALGGTSAAPGPAGEGASTDGGGVVWAYVTPSVVAAAWQAGHPYAVGNVVSNGGRAYQVSAVTGAATSAAAPPGPTGTGSGITDGLVTWASITLPGRVPLANGSDDALSTPANAGLLTSAFVAQFTGGTNPPSPPAFDPYDIELLACPETSDPAVIGAALTYCANRGDCMFVGHVPDRSDVPTVKAWVAAHNLQNDKVYGALYYPFIQIVDPVGTTVWIPPEGHVMGVYARTDQQRGIWKAPAGNGAVVQNALDVRTRITDTDHTDLVKNGSVNAIRPITGAGIVVDSSRTLSTNTLWLYVNVRRLFNYVKTSLRYGLRWVVQEPNDTTLWNKVKFNSVTPFLMGLYRRGAFGPGKPEQVFTVVCDASNNPPENIQQGIFNVGVYFYPSRPAETIIITVGQQDGGATAGES